MRTSLLSLACVVGMLLCGTVEAVVIQGVVVPNKYFMYRADDGLPLEIKSFQSPDWAQLGLVDAVLLFNGDFQIAMVAPTGRVVSPTSWGTGVDGDYQFYEIGQGQDGPPLSRWYAEIDYEFSFDTYVGESPRWTQPFDTVVEFLSQASITFQPGGMFPEGTYSGGTMVPWITGDLNGDDTIDAVDAAVAFANWGADGVSDLNGDGITDAADAGVLFASWTGDASHHAVPEPSLLVSVLLMLIPYYSSRRAVSGRATVV